MIPKISPNIWVDRLDLDVIRRVHVSMRERKRKRRGGRGGEIGLVTVYECPLGGALSRFIGDGFKSVTFILHVLSLYDTLTLSLSLGCNRFCEASRGICSRD